MYMKLVSTIKDLRSFCEKLIDTSDLTMTEVLILSALNESESAISIGTIANLTGIAKPNMTPNIDRLERNGYITRVRSTNDRRQILIVLTDKGTETIKAIDDRISGLRGISSAEKALDQLIKFTSEQ